MDTRTNPAVKPACFPVCKACRENGCTKEWPKIERGQWKQDRLAGKRLKCGHICDVLPIVSGIVDKKGHCMASHVLCDTCHEWQPIRWDSQLPEVKQVDPSKQLVIPF